MDLRRGCFSAKMYAKMKEFGPVGGHAPSMPPPRSANDVVGELTGFEYDLFSFNLDYSHADSCAMNPFGFLVAP